jgi:hypothetical protein
MVTPMISYADVAGSWSVNVMPEDRDTTILMYDFVATADTTGWTITFPGRQPIPVHVMPPTADSIVVHAGPFESALRPGVMVNTTGVIRVRDGKVVGTTTARYVTTGADSVSRFRTSGTKKM